MTGNIVFNRRSTWQNKVFGLYASLGGWVLKGLSVAAERYTILSPSKISFAIDGTLFVAGAQAEIDLSDASNWDATTPTDYTIAANRAGKDFYLYAVITADGADATVLLSANSTVPGGYSAVDSRKIGGFHCLCVAVGTISGHSLAGFVAGDVLPASIWDADHRPISSPEGMVLAKSGKWIDIYLPSVSVGELVSAYNATIVDGVSAEAFHTYKFEQWFARIGKKTISQLEFVDASIGSNQGTSISGTADPGTTGGHSDTAGRRMISGIGCEDMCGAMWQWGRDMGAHIGTTAWKDAFDGNDAGVGGQSYEEPFRPLLGGYWDSGAVCGSRGSNWSLWFAARSGFRRIFSGRCGAKKLEKCVGQRV